MLRLIYIVREGGVPAYATNMSASAARLSDLAILSSLPGSRIHWRSPIMKRLELIVAFT